MEEIISKVIDKVSPEALTFLAIFYGIWKLANKFLFIFKLNSENLVKEVSGIKDALEGHSGRLESHEFRIDKLEKKG